jgi:methylmalonyl-CoA mutase
MSETKKQSGAGPLLAEFSAVGYDDWHKLVEAELKGAPFDKRMLTSTYEGITLRPVYRREDTEKLPHVNSYPGFAPFVRGGNASGYLKEPWAVSQEIAYSSPTDFNHAARNSLSRGLNALNMVLDKATRNGHDPDWAQPEEVGSGGLSIATLDDLDRALEGVDLDTTSLFIRSGASAMPFAALLVALARKRGKSPSALRGCIEMDPLGILAHEGTLPQSLAGAYREMAALTQWASAHAPGLQTICVHSRSWHESGGNAVQELAFTLATGIEYVREMDKQGAPVDVVAPRMRFAVTVGVNFLMEIAKLRALRMLWSRAIGAAGGNEASQKLSLHVRTSQWNKTVYDPYNNLLRVAVEAFAGVLGGCDSMQAGTFDEVIRPPDDVSLRIARNTQLVLQKECDLIQVIDPAGGSWCIETLTTELAAKAWTLFQEVEKLGGMEAALRVAFPQKVVTAVAAEKIKAVSRRRDSIVGVNQYANPAEKPLERPDGEDKSFYRQRVRRVASHRMSLEDWENETVLDKLSRVVDLKGTGLFEACVKAVSAGATLGETARAIRISDTACDPITPVRFMRVAAPFERLRNATVRDGKARKGLPDVFLCNMGGLRDYKARADFSRGFFAIGGYEVVSPEGFKTPEAAAEAFAKSKARVAVICSTDENYPALVPALVAAIRASRPGAVIVLAGYSPDQIEAHKQSGVDEFIHVRADAVELLAIFHSRLGIEA